MFHQFNSRRFVKTICAAAAISLASTASTAYTPTEAYQTTKINGWVVYIAPGLSKTPRERNRMVNEVTKQTALVARALTDKQLKVLRKSSIWLEDRNFRHPDDRHIARYYNSKTPIFQDNLNPKKYRDVEVDFSFARINHPMLMVHELAHVYHDRKLGPSNRKVRKLYETFARSYAKVAKDKCGRVLPAYALRNDGEFFATFSEAYFGKTCNYPYNRTTLAKNHPDIYAFLSQTWGSF